jgi:hypothetical protein
LAAQGLQLDEDLPPSALYCPAGHAKRVDVQAEADVEPAGDVSGAGQVEHTVALDDA